MGNMKRFAMVSGVAMAAAVALTVPTAVAAEATASAPPSAPFSAIVVNGSNSGGSFVRDASTNTFTMLGNRNLVQLQGNAVDHPPFVILAAVDPLVVGDLAVDGSSQNPAALRLSDGVAQECVVTGTLHVTEVTFGPDDVATSFAADYSGTCDGGRPSTGQIRYNSATGYQGLDITPSRSWTAPFVGEKNAPTAVTVTARGTDTTTISAVDVVGDSPANFVVPFGQDTCTGAALAHLDSCTVTVAASPRSLSPAPVVEHLAFTTSQSTSPVGTTLTYTGPQLSKRGQYFPTNVRVMDTRTGLGVRRGVVSAGKTVSLPVAGHNGVPATGVSAAVFNVTVTGATAPSFATVYPGGTVRPTTSNLNFGKGFTGANLVTVPLGSNGAVNFFNKSGSVQFVADLVGYYAAGPTFSKSGGNDLYTSVPERVFDSRVDWQGEKLASREYFPVPLTYGPALDPRIRGFVITLTAVNATSAGFLAVTPTEPTGPPTTSSLNYQPGGAVANLVAAKTSQVNFGGTNYPTIWIANSSGASTHVLVDIVGLFAQEADGDEGLRFRPVAPTRILDTIHDVGAKSVGTSVNTVVPAPVNVSGRDTWALAGNITGVTPTANTFLTMWDEGARPGISSVNLTKGVTRANAAWTGVSPTNTYSVFNKAGTTETLYDVSGTFEAWPPSPATVAGIPLNRATTDSRASALVPGGTRTTAPTVGDVRRVERPEAKHY